MKYKFQRRLNGFREKLKNKILSRSIPKGVTSYPFISGDTFRALASNHIESVDGEIIIKKVRAENNLYFVEMDLFNSHDISQYIPTSSQLIIHNGDGSPRKEILRKLVNNAINVYTVNLKENYKNCWCIPIGIENAHWNKNGAISYYNGSFVLKKERERNEEIIVSFSVETNKLRRTYYQNVASTYGCYNKTGLTLVEFRAALRENMFILSPPGNGIDCHRTWEAIYHGCVPVIETEDWLFTNNELPVLVVKSLSDFFSLTKAERVRLYNSTVKKCSKFAYMDYWITRLQR